MYLRNLLPAHDCRDALLRLFLCRVLVDGATSRQGGFANERFFTVPAFVSCENQRAARASGHSRQWSLLACGYRAPLGPERPTVSKAALSLQKAWLLEEVEGNGPVIGRPAMKLRLASASAQVLGIVIDINRCSVVASGLDGEICEERTRRVETHTDYPSLIASLVKEARALMARPGVRTLGVGVTVPGLIDHRRGLDILSPNVHVIDGRSPGRDLGQALGIECVMIQDQHALCMAERYYGRAKGLDDFAVFDLELGRRHGRDERRPTAARTQWLCRRDRPHDRGSQRPPVWLRKPRLP